MLSTHPKVPEGFRPPIVTKEEQGVAAFHAYDWYFRSMQRYLRDKKAVFLTPCAATKPIHTSPLHRRVYQKYAMVYGGGRNLFVVSEPVVLIRYRDLFDLEPHFCYDFPCPLLGSDARALFVKRLRSILLGKDIVGCLPRHHATLVNDAVGKGWKNHWDGDLYTMMHKASLLLK